MKVTYASDEPRLFWFQEKSKDPPPQGGIKMVEVLGLSLYKEEQFSEQQLFPHQWPLTLILTWVWNADCGSPSYDISCFACPLRISGRSDIQSRTVMVRYGAEFIHLMLLTIFFSSTMALSWHALGANTLVGSGYRGSFSPGAAARMMALRRVWGTP